MMNTEHFSSVDQWMKHRRERNRRIQSKSISSQCLRDLQKDEFNIKKKPRLKVEPEIEEAVPCHRVIIRDCDEPPYEYLLAGIGQCFQGKTYDRVGMMQ